MGCLPAPPARLYRRRRRAARIVREPRAGRLWPAAGARRPGGSARRQLDHERGAAAGARLGPDAAVHQLDELAADVEPEPGPAHAAREVGIEPEEFVEHAL